MKSNKLSKLSVLQKELLEKALRAYHRTPLDLAGQSVNPGCFGVQVSRVDMETGRQLQFHNRGEANQRAAAGHAIARLILRGLVECGSERGKWKLTKAGLKVAKALYPELKPISKQEMAGQIRMAAAFRSVTPRPRRRKPRAKATGRQVEPGIEVEMDF